MGRLPWWQPRRPAGPLPGLTWRGGQDRRGATAADGTAADGSSEGGRVGGVRRVFGSHLDEGDRTVAAPPQMGHQTDGYDGDRRRPEQSYIDASI